RYCRTERIDSATMVSDPPSRPAAMSCAIITMSRIRPKASERSRARWSAVRITAGAGIDSEAQARAHDVERADAGEIDMRSVADRAGFEIVGGRLMSHQRVAEARAPALGEGGEIVPADG